MNEFSSKHLFKFLIWFKTESVLIQTEQNLNGGYRFSLQLVERLLFEAAKTTNSTLNRIKRHFQTDQIVF